MDPAFIALFGTLLGGLFLKTVEHYCSKAKTNREIIVAVYGKEAGSESIAHKTRMMELENFPDWHAEWYTKCDCSKCTYVYADGNKWQPEPAKVIAIPRPTKPLFYRRIVDGYVFDVPANVPREAKAHYDHKYQCGLFMWYLPDGRVQSLKLVPHMEIEPASVYADQYEKPVLQVKPRRASDIQIETYELHRQALLDREMAVYRDQYLIDKYRHRRTAPRIETERAYK